jgi:hypothetical protein
VVRKVDTAVAPYGVATGVDVLWYCVNRSSRRGDDGSNGPVAKQKNCRDFFVIVI